MVNTNKSQIIDLIIRSVKEIGAEQKNRHLTNIGSKTELYGRNGYLDSLTLLRLIVTIEEKLSGEIGKEILIADENTMSQATSPFRNVESLAIHIENLINQNGN
jgi:acyl carrier protein